MTAKEKNLNSLYKARASQLKLVNTIKLLVSGLTVDKNRMVLPIVQESEIGTWYYEQALQFSRFTSQKVLEEMESLLEEMFNFYAKIYTIYFQEKKSSFGAFFGKRDHGVSNNDAELASRYYEDIVKLSDEFKKKLQVFEKQLVGLQENEHGQISDFSLFDEEKERKTARQAQRDEAEVEVYSLRAR